MTMLGQEQEDNIKEKVKERYGKIALTGNSDCCCMPSECCSNINNNNTTNNQPSPVESARVIGYDTKDIESIPQASVLGVGCGVPTKFAEIREGETIVDLGSGAGIDVFLAANKVGKSGKVIGVDMTDEMLEKAKKNASNNGYTNVEFVKGDIERRIPVEDNTADVVISNCVINLTSDKVATFKEIHRILKNDGGRMLISDLVTDREIAEDSINPEKWCTCIDGALTKEKYLDSIRQGGFQTVEVLEERPYIDDQVDNEKRRISSLVIKAVKNQATVQDVAKSHKK
ncbi:MAG TPA: arsenite methyltransferase [Nitrososphaeraceae archaeon]|nr:arsenite methyltransferase [Nitrososphaeraceae archaeon]